MVEGVRVLARPKSTGGGVGGRIELACDEDFVEAMGVQDLKPHAGRLDVDRLYLQARNDKDVAHGGLRHL